MNTYGSVIVLLLCFMILFTLTDCSTCQTYKLEGDTLIFKLTDRLLKDDDRFTIKKDNIFVVRKRNRRQEGRGIVKNQFLELQHVKLNDSGTYIVEVFDVEGTQVKSYSEIVCVYAKVPKPRVNITCQNETVYLRCDVEGDKDQRSSISYSWHKNEEINMTLSNTSILVDADNSNYTCTAQNPVHNSTSDPVKAACFMSDMNSALSVMVGILAGGGGLILFLTVVLMTVACRACKRREKQRRDEEELRLDYVNTSSFSGQQKLKQTANLSALSDTQDNGSAKEAAQVTCKTKLCPKNQKHTRPPPPPADDGEEQYPPLPQPRKKAPVKKHER